MWGFMDNYEEDENPTVALKNPLDVNELRNPSSEGVCFEVKEDPDDLPEEDFKDNSGFDPEDVAKNFYHDDESDEAESDDDSTPFERMARKMQDISVDHDGGVMKRVLVEGSGPVVPPDSLVRVHFNGFLEYADEPYDSSRLRNRVFKFRVGQGEVIEGWDVGVLTMRKGELSRFLIKPLYAYGHYGVPPRIPQDATVMFEIELLSFVEQAGVEDYFNMTESERRCVTLEEVKKVYVSITKEANQLFDAKQIHRAFAKYKRACNIMEDHHLKNEAEEKEQRKLLLRLYLNMALCCIKQCHSGRAISYSRKAIDIDERHPKALYLHGKALHQMSEFDRARTFMKRAQRLKPHDKDINAELEKIDKDMKNFKLVEKDMYSRMFAKPKGQTEAEKAAEDSRIEKAEENCTRCSDGFRKMVQEKMMQFKEDKDLIELPMPSYNFTVGEISCILETAEDLDLEYKERGSGQSKQIRIIKRQPELT